MPRFRRGAERAGRIRVVSPERAREGPSALPGFAHRSRAEGTHDYYNEYGLEARTWDGKTLILKGDAWMRPQDADRASIAIQASLVQFLEASDGRGAFASFRLNETPLQTPDTMNACRLEVMPARDLEKGLGVLLTDIVRSTPVPGLSEGEGELPRFRSEVGPFIGFVPAVRFGFLGGGFGQGQTRKGVTGGLEMAIRLGLGLDGIPRTSSFNSSAASSRRFPRAARSSAASGCRSG